MKVLHAAQSIDPPVGIMNQMGWEQQAACHLGLDWEVKIFTPVGNAKNHEIIELSKPISAAKNSIARIKNWWNLRVAYYKWLKSREENIDVFILRHSTYDIFQLVFIGFCKKPVFLVHHTLEIAELASSGTKLGRGKAFLEKWIGRYSIEKCEGIIGVTREIIEYEKERIGCSGKVSILYPNGIFYESSTIEDGRGAIPEFLFVASFFAPWHGLDLLLSAINNSNDSFVLHLVGDLSNDDKILAQKDNRIVLHGRKTHDEIKLIAKNCLIGISSFALYRKDMHEACTLKVREYLMMGLPVYTGHKDIFPESFLYYKKGELNVSSIFEFALENRDKSRKQVAEAAKKYIDKIDLLENLSIELDTIYKNCIASIKPV